MSGSSLSLTQVRLLVFFYFLSGTCSLAYEVLWARMLSIQFGVSIFGVIATICAFMLGLGIGSITGVKIIKNSKHMLLLFAGIEAGIALISLLLPQVFSYIDQWIFQFSAHWSTSVWYFFQFCMVIILLFLPALLMGLGFPILLSVLRNTKASLSQIYGINALGAAFGAILPLLLLPYLGWLGAIQFIAGISFSVALGVSVIALRHKTIFVDIEKKTLFSVPKQTNALILYAGIGLAALMLEIGWTRLFGMIFLRTEYVLAIILAVYLGGVGLGSLAAAYMRHRIWFVILPATAGLFIILSLWLLPAIGAAVNDTETKSYLSLLLHQGSIIAALTLPVTIVLGAWLPLLTRHLGDVPGMGAWLYGVNSLGAALGALIGGLLLIPNYGTNTTIIIAALLLCALGLKWSQRKSAWLAIPVLLVLAYPVFIMPDVAHLKPASYANSIDLYRYEDAINITHVVERQDGQRLLLSDLQRMDASSDPTAVEVQKNQARLPLMLHANPRSVLFLGVGTGITAAGSLSYPDLQRTAVEISQGALNAAQDWFKQVNQNVLSATTVVRDDARRFLMRNNESYDVIVGDLFHPDLVGRSALLSVQQFRRAKARLTNDGIFVQWIALNQFDVESFEVVLRSFNQVFPNSVIFIDAFRLAFVGTKSHSEFAAAVNANWKRFSPQQRIQAMGGEGQWTWLGRYWGHIDVANGVTQDEWAPQIEYKLPFARYNGDLDLVKLLNYLINKRVHVDNAAKELLVSSQHLKAFESAFIATDLAHHSWIEYLTKNRQQGQRDLQMAYKANPNDRWVGFAIADGVMASLPPNSDDPQLKNILHAVLKVRPDHPEALRRMWQLELQNGDQQQAINYKNRLAAISPFDRSLVSK